MFEYALMILIFIGVMAVTALIFGAWVVVTLLSMVLRGITAIFAPASLPPLPMTRNGVACSNAKCKALNVDSARFCRRCGGELPQAQRVTTRRVAMW